jgi:ABC-2 type transport system ATP-binding protein
MAEIVLQTQNLTKRYNGLTAVDDLTLEVYQGEIFGLLGPNGAGKTTSIHMMCGLLQPDAGQVRIQGEVVHGGGRQARRRVGMCPQETILWEKLTCLEQLEFIGEMYDVPRAQACQRGQELLGTLGLAEKTHSLATSLSGGMQRRLNLALALIHDPDILVLDEPEAGLDPQSRVLVREYIQSLARQKTIILTTHNMDEADRMADRVAIIDHGKLLVVDAPHELKRIIGEGDVLELAIKGVGSGRARAAIAEFYPNLSLRAEPAKRSNLHAVNVDRFVAQVAPRDDVIAIRAKNIADRLPDIINIIQRVGGQVAEVHLRPNTLEDVFISLTGRRLRE